MLVEMLVMFWRMGYRRVECEREIAKDKAIESSL